MESVNHVHSLKIALAKTRSRRTGNSPTIFKEYFVLTFENCQAFIILLGIHEEFRRNSKGIQGNSDRVPGNSAVSSYARTYQAWESGTCEISPSDPFIILIRLNLWSGVVQSLCGALWPTSGQ